MGVLKWFNNKILGCVSSNHPCSKTEDIEYHEESKNSLCSKTEYIKYDEDTGQYYDRFNCPDDIWIEIFSSLPVDQLQVVKKVCRHWRRLICSYDFLKLHIKRAKYEAIKNPVMFVEHFEYTWRIFRQSFWLGDGRSEANLPSVERIRKQCDDIDTIRVVDSCDGLLMFHIQPGRRSLIINPMTQESKIITSPDNVGNTCCIFFDGFEEDYRLLHLSRLRRNHLHDEYIYSFNRDVWTRLKSVQTCHHFLPRLNDPPVVVCDALHWIGYSLYPCSKMVLVFKIETKEFFYLPAYPTAINTKLYINTNCCLSLKPDDLQDASINESMQLLKKDEKLCLCHAIIRSEVFEIWSLQEYGDWGSWERILKIDLSLVRINNTRTYFSQGCMRDIKIMSFDGDDILIVCWQKGLYLYNLETKNIRAIEHPKLTNASRLSLRVIPLIETSLSPNIVYTTL